MVVTAAKRVTHPDVKRAESLIFGKFVKVKGRYVHTCSVHTVCQFHQRVGL